MKLLNEIKPLSQYYEKMYYNMPDEEAIYANTGMEVHYTMHNNLGTFYKSARTMFLARPNTCDELTGTCLFFQLHPQSGFPGLFFFTNESIITEVNKSTQANLEQICQNPSAIQEYFRHLPLLQSLKAKISPESFVVHKNSIQVVQPNFFSITDEVPVEIYHAAEQLGIPHETIINMEEHRLNCELRKRRNHILEFMETALEISKNKNYLQQFIAYVENV